MGATATSDEDVTRLLPVLRAASLRAQTQLGAATGTAPVDKRPESSRSTTSDELDAAARSTVVRAAVGSKSAPNGLSDAHIRQCHLGSPVREICTPGSAWGDEIKRLCLLGEAPARKCLCARGSARATVVKTRLYHPVGPLVRTASQTSVARRGLSGP